jgi:hypothetical protein
MIDKYLATTGSEIVGSNIFLWHPNCIPRQVGYSYGQVKLTVSSHTLIRKLK